MAQNKIRIAIFLDNRNRELLGLLQLQKVLKKELTSEVIIFGSIAERQRVFYFLYQFKPHVVFLSQSVEDGVRELCKYIKESGAKVYILPAEITVMRTLSKLIINPMLKYNHLVDGVFLPGKRMKELYSNTDIDSSKLHIVGSPKLDALSLERKDGKIRRNKFSLKHNLPKNKLNVFIFTSFVPMNSSYIDVNESLRSEKKMLLENNKYLDETKKAFKKAIIKLCEDFPSLSIIHKPHPLEKTNYSSDIRRNNFITLTDTSINDCISSVDIGIHWSSTVAIECWIRGIKTIQFIPIQGKDYFLSEMHHGNPVARNYAQLIKHLQKYTSMPLEEKFLKYQKRYLSENYFVLDGNSSKRISEIIRTYDPRGFEVNYRANFSKTFLLLSLIANFLGWKIVRRLVAMFVAYNWKYANENSYIKR